MPSSIAAPSIKIPIEPLTSSAFAPFGTVIRNPARASSTDITNAVPTAVRANQGTALKYLDPSHLTDYYHLAPSRKPAQPVLNLFVCAPRKLRPDTSWNFSGPMEEISDAGEGEKELFDVALLERHPYTSQTFVPLGLAGTERKTQYLVIVAPTLSTAQSRTHGWEPPYPLADRRKRRSLREVFQRARPSPFTNDKEPPLSARRGPELLMKGQGRPDLKNLRAFLASGDQAVTYAAGTWHAPMVVLGTDDVDFVVVQHANGVRLEDCQEVELAPAVVGAGGISVEVETEGGAVMERLGPLKAKL